ncbi:GNAT family N-acetyltransferase [Flavimarina sp. Hel_I_48]|uniref:GNAT family N-acetyltransferase n=1 Tax=Flavimarina sp. Hel_I_48 TaxID=1392488 RepID=UPI0004DF18C5|nr:GNAT family N-acetyltransferase [Flavimarina sp. Hel_I_48]
MIDPEYDTFKPEYKEAFEHLNIAWLDEFFVVEAYDRKVLGNPQEFIIDKQGHILIAKIDNRVVGTVALMKIDEAEYELTKMAIDKAYRGQKIGQKLLTFALSFAKENLITSLILYSNRTLENAIYIYGKFGFEEVPLETNTPYNRADIKMKLNL